MNASIQPLVNLVNANMAVSFRLANSSEVKEATKGLTEKYISVTQDGLERIAKSEAVVEWTRAIQKNYANFVQEWMQSYFGIFQQSQNFLTRQAEETTQHVRDAVDATTDVANRTLEATEEAAEEATSLTKARQSRQAR